MIARAAKILLDELNAAIASEDAGEASSEEKQAMLGNVALADQQEASQGILNKIVLSVVNIADEAAFKNAPHFERTGGEVRYRNAPKYLNLFVLFSATHGDYETALRRLSQVITFFQGKHVFTLKDSPGQVKPDDELAEMKLILELYALTFEQVNYVWASLGGKQMPFVMYKVRLVRIQAERLEREAPPIEEVSGTETAV